MADTIVVSKTDLADDAALDALAARLSAINPGARQFRVANGDIEASQILDQAGFTVAGRSEAARGWLNDRSYAATVQPASADPAISTFALSYDEEITLPGFVLWMNLLAGFRGAGLLRVKGIVNVEGKPYAVQAVQTIVSEPVSWKPGRKTTTAARGWCSSPAASTPPISGAPSPPSASRAARAQAQHDHQSGNLRALPRHDRIIPPLAAAPAGWRRRQST